MRCSTCHRRVPESPGCPLHAIQEPAATAPTELATTPTPSPEEQATDAPELPGFRLFAPLGRGGFATVYAARRESDGLEVAIKIAHVPDDERFRREDWALRQVGDPIAPGLLASGALPEGHPFLVLERLRGETLADLLERQPGAGQMAPTEAL